MNCQYADRPRNNKQQVREHLGNFLGQKEPDVESIDCFMYM